MKNFSIPYKVASHLPASGTRGYNSELLILLDEAISGMRRQPDSGRGERMADRQRAAPRVPLA